MSLETLDERALPSAVALPPEAPAGVRVAAAAPAALLPSATFLNDVRVDWPAGKPVPTGLIISANVAGSFINLAPTGLCDIYDGNTKIGSLPVLAFASGFSFVAGTIPWVMSAGAHTITARYPGNAVYLPSAATASFDMTLESVDAGSTTPPSPTQPTGGNLTWANFRQPEQGEPYAAFTFADLTYLTKYNITTLTTTRGATIEVMCRGRITNSVSWSEFVPAKSYSVPAAQTNALLVHENLHLTLFQWVAGKAASNLPEVTGAAGTQTTVANVAVAKAKAASDVKDQLKNKMDAFY